MFQRLLLLWLCLLCYIAYRHPSPFLASAPATPYLFALTMFAIGWMLPRDEVRKVARRWPLVLGGTAIQYASMPLLAAGMGMLFGLEDELLIGVMLVGCVPGAMASNVLTLAAGGNVSYSLSLTTMATMLSPLCVPAALHLALGEHAEGSFAEQSRTFAERSLLLVWLVVLPAILGYLIGRRFEPWRNAARRVGSTVANLAILWIIAVVIAENRERLAAWEDFELLLPALACLNLLGYSAGFLGALALRLPWDMRRALTLEIGMQNAGLGVLLAQTWYRDRPEVALAPALYTFGCMFTGTALAGVWAGLGGNPES